MVNENQKLYKCVPHGWNEKNSYVICKRQTIERRHGIKPIVLYYVLNRWSAGAYGEAGQITKGLRGVEYLDIELKTIEEIN